MPSLNEPEGRRSQGGATATAPQNVIEVELPDGTVVEVAGVTTPEAAARAARAYLKRRPTGPTAGAPVAATPSPAATTAPADPVAAAAMRPDPEPHQSIAQQIGGAIGRAAAGVPQLAVERVLSPLAQAARGVREGVAAVAGLPVDIANAGLSLAGLGSEKPVAGSKQLDELLNGFGAFEPPPAQNFGERMLRRVGTEVGAAAVPVAGALRAGAMGAEAARKLPPVVREFVESAATAPGQFVAREGTTAAAAGTGAGLVGEMTGRNRAVGEGHEPTTGQQLGDLAGALGGAGAVGAVRLVGPAVADVVGAITGSPARTSQVVREAVAEQIGQNFIGPASQDADTRRIVEAIERGRRVGDAVPGFRDTLAARTSNAGLAALEQSRNTGPNSGLFAQRRAENTAAVDSALAGVAPQGSPSDLRNALAVERDRQLAEAADRTRAAQTTFNQAADRLQAVRATADARGADIRAALEDAKAAARDVEREAWRGVSDAGEVDIRPLAASFQRVTGGLSEAERRQFVPRDIVSIPDAIIERGSRATPRWRRHAPICRPRIAPSSTPSSAAEPRRTRP